MPQTNYYNGGEGAMNRYFESVGRGDTSFESGQLGVRVMSPAPRLVFDGNGASLSRISPYARRGLNLGSVGVASQSNQKPNNTTCVGAFGPTTGSP